MTLAVTRRLPGACAFRSIQVPMDSAWWVPKADPFVVLLDLPVTHSSPSYRCRTPS